MGKKYNLEVYITFDVIDEGIEKVKARYLNESGSTVEVKSKRGKEIFADNWFLTYEEAKTRANWFLRQEKRSLRGQVGQLLWQVELLRAEIKRVEEMSFDEEKTVVGS